MTVAGQPVFRAAGAAFVPDLTAADDVVWSEIEATVEHALAQRTAAVRRQLRLLLRLLGILGRLRFGQRLDRVPLDARRQFLERLQYGRLPLLRRGVWGLRTLVLMGHYTRPAVMQAIGYRAHADGWTGSAAAADMKRAQ